MEAKSGLSNRYGPGATVVVCRALVNAYTSVRPESSSHPLRYSGAESKINQNDGAKVKVCRSVRPRHLVYCTIALTRTLLRESCGRNARGIFNDVAMASSMHGGLTSGASDACNTR